MRFTVNIIVFVGVICIAVPLLQWRLSKCASRLPGLVLPIITLLYALLAVCSYVVYDGQTVLSIALNLLLIFLLSNIPTFILLAIYFGVRSSLRKRSAIDRMNIQDL